MINNPLVFSLFCLLMNTSDQTHKNFMKLKIKKINKERLFNHNIEILNGKDYAYHLLLFFCWLLMSTIFKILFFFFINRKRSMHSIEIQRLCIYFLLINFLFEISAVNKKYRKVVHRNTNTLFQASKNNIIDYQSIEKLRWKE